MDIKDQIRSMKLAEADFVTRAQSEIDKTMDRIEEGKYAEALVYLHKAKSNLINAHESREQGRQLEASGS